MKTKQQILIELRDESRLDGYDWDSLISDVVIDEKGEPVAVTFHPGQPVTLNEISLLLKSWGRVTWVAKRLKRLGPG
jgi:hypothetical protein